MNIMLLSIVLLGLSLGLVYPSGQNEVKLERGNCPMFWYSFKGRCYKYVATHTSWADAELHCLSQKANLVSIHSLEEHNFVQTLVQNFDHSHGKTWIGLSDTQKEGAWMWSDGCPVEFVLWDKVQPDNAHGNEDCATLNYGEERKWNDVGCFDTFTSVCASRISCLTMSFML